MCNLYSITSNQKAIIDLARALRDVAGNVPSLPGVFPDYPAPIVRIGADGLRELAMARWGMPTPRNFLEGKKTDKGVTNVRNVSSPHWRRWLAIGSRCVVPFNSFSENAPVTFDPVWFALNVRRPLAFFAGIWTPWTSVRKVKEGETKNDIFAFLTTTPNAEVAPTHPKAMPVILTTPEEVEMWLTGPPPVALQLQRPLPDGSLKIVAIARGSSRGGSGSHDYQDHIFVERRAHQPTANNGRLHARLHNRAIRRKPDTRTIRRWWQARARHQSRGDNGAQHRSACRVSRRERQYH
jgi:putative SOS response-associated peptidase YedK